MRILLLVMAAAAICLGVTTGCERTVGGTVAMTTQPGPTTTRPWTTSARPTTSAPTNTAPTSEVPAPANASTMTCREYSQLDDATRLAVLRAILADEQGMFPGGSEDIAKTVADAMCQFLPDSTVKELLLGEPPR